MRGEWHIHCRWRKMCIHTCHIDWVGSSPPFTTVDFCSNPALDWSLACGLGFQSLTTWVFPKLGFSYNIQNRTSTCFLHRPTGYSSTHLKVPWFHNQKAKITTNSSWRLVVLVHVSVIMQLEITTFSCEIYLKVICLVICHHDIFFYKMQ